MEDKFQRGLRQLAEAGHDKDKLGMSLISLHGALEEYFRSQLAAEIAIDENDQGRRRTDWQDLLNLWQRHRNLSYHDRELIFTKNGKRNAVAHGDPFEINRSEMEQYAQFVQDFMGVYVAPTISQTQPASPPPNRRPTSTSSPTAKPPPAPTVSNTSYTKAKPSCLIRLAKATLFLIIGCTVFTFAVFYFLSDIDIGNGRDGIELLQEIGGTNTPDIIREGSEDEKEAAPPTPTPTRIIFTADKLMIQVVGNSYLRAEPGQDFNIVGTVMDDEIYEVLETSDNGQWYKIKAQSGKEGWLGSTRATKISP